MFQGTATTRARNCNGKFSVPPLFEQLASLDYGDDAERTKPLKKQTIFVMQI